MSINVKGKWIMNPNVEMEVDILFMDLKNVNVALMAML